jgi:hypothetical protein
MSPDTTFEPFESLEQMFHYFCCTDPFRTSMRMPFDVGDKTYATNAHILIRCDTDLIDFEYINNETPPDVLSIIPQPNTSEIIDLDSIDWLNLGTEDDLIESGDDVECGYCDGNGTLEESIFYKNRCYHYEFDCPVCDGSGFEETAKEIPSGHKTFKLWDKVKLKDTYFFIRNFYKLKKIKDFMGADIELISYSSDVNCFMFRIGFIEAVIMPCMGTESDDIVVNLD